jgi:hypothetical protein
MFFAGVAFFVGCHPDLKKNSDRYAKKGKDYFFGTGLNTFS